MLILDGEASITPAGSCIKYSVLEAYTDTNEPLNRLLSCTDVRFYACSRLAIRLSLFINHDHANRVFKKELHAKSRICRTCPRSSRESIINRFENLLSTSRQTKSSPHASSVMHRHRRPRQRDPRKTHQRRLIPPRFLLKKRSDKLTLTCCSHLISNINNRASMANRRITYRHIIHAWRRKYRSNSHPIICLPEQK